MSDVHGKMLSDCMRNIRQGKVSGGFLREQDTVAAMIGNQSRCCVIAGRLVEQYMCPRCGRKAT